MAWLTEVAQSHVFLCFCLGDQGRWFWSQFTCRPHTGTDSSPSELFCWTSILTDDWQLQQKPSSCWEANVDTQCLTKHEFCSSSLRLEIYVVSLFCVTSYLHSSWRNEIIFNSFQHQSWLKLLGSIANRGTLYTRRNYGHTKPTLLCKPREALSAAQY